MMFLMRACERPDSHPTFFLGCSFQATGRGEVVGKKHCTGDGGFCIPKNISLFNNKGEYNPNTCAHEIKTNNRNVQAVLKGF